MIASSHSRPLARFGLHWFILLVLSLTLCSPVHAEPVAVKYLEGISHGFLVLRSLDGGILASGDQFQVVEGNQVTSETVFHFKDGSLHDETVVFVQGHTFRLLSDHLIQKGPSFPHPIDILIDGTKNEVTIHAAEKNQEKNVTQQMDVPADLVNGMVPILLKNISLDAETKLPMLAPTAKPRIIHLAIKTIDDNATYSVAGSKRKAIHFNIHVEIGGVAGVVAPLVGKLPPDTHIWISAGHSPTFLRSQGPLFEGGPIWRIDLAPIQMRQLQAK